MMSTVITRIASFVKIEFPIPATQYLLSMMPGSTENVSHHAIWRLRGSLDENASFSSLSHTFRLI